ncbi:MAG TPA: acyl-CoA thioesterase domain-containing protein [Acidimicrobiales bacterium]|jgi:acyl-CoA thioesterase|nr:acyl-CoA thioesterase domain-containing protein [Acidimicrobiales bacterium]
MAVVADLASALDFEQVEPGRCRFSNVGLGERGVVFGGQLLAQMAVAAATADSSGTKWIKSAHGLFARPVLVAEDMDVTVDLLHGGRTLAMVTATVWQGDRPCARGQILLDVGEPDLIRHGSEAPDVDGPDASVPWGDPVEGREIRTVDGVDILDAESTGPAEVYAWVRTSGPSDKAVVNQALLAHATASFLIGTAMRPHAGVGQSVAHRHISTGIVGHTISFHEAVEPGQWLLLANESPFAGRGRAFGRGQVFTQSGQLVASFSQEAMIRHFPAGRSAAGREDTVL